MYSSSSEGFFTGSRFAMVVIKSGADLLEHPELEGGDAVCLPACLPRSQGSVFWPPHSESHSVAAFPDPPPFPPLNPLFLPARAEKGHKVKAKGREGKRIKGTLFKRVKEELRRMSGEKIARPTNLRRIFCPSFTRTCGR